MDGPRALAWIHCPPGVQWRAVHGQQLADTTAARVVRHGGVIAYPTEAVWGLGCDPWNDEAVERLLVLNSGELVAYGPKAKVLEHLQRTSKAHQEQQA